MCQDPEKLGLLLQVSAPSQLSRPEHKLTHLEQCLGPLSSSSQRVLMIHEQLTKSAGGPDLRSPLLDICVHAYTSLYAIASHSDVGFQPSRVPMEPKVE